MALQSWLDQSEKLFAVEMVARVHFRDITAARVSITDEIGLPGSRHSPATEVGSTMQSDILNENR